MLTSVSSDVMKNSLKKKVRHSTLLNTDTELVFFFLNAEDFIVSQKTFGG